MASIQDRLVKDLTVAELTELLKGLNVAAAAPAKSKSKKAQEGEEKPKKPVSEGVAAWNAYVTEVKEELGCSRKEAMAEASKRKAAADPAYAAASAARRAKRDEQLAKKGSVPPSPEKPSPEKEKPKKVLSPEHLAKMKAGREAKKAAASMPAPEPSPVPVAVAVAEAQEVWERKTISGKKYLLNPANNHCYRCEADGSQGDWAGVYDPKIKKIDDSVEEPEELPLCADCEKEPVMAKGHRYCEACK